MRESKTSKLSKVGTLTLPAEMRPRWEPMLGSGPEPWRVLPGKDTKYGQLMKIPMFTVIANAFRSGLYSIFSHSYVEFPESKGFVSMFLDPQSNGTLDAD